MSAATACEGCARRSWLLGRLAAHLDPVRARIDELLLLGDEDLIDAVAGGERDAVRRELAAGRTATVGGVAGGAPPAGTIAAAVCRCHPIYPRALLELPAPPAVLHLTGPAERLQRLLAEPAVAIVGARAASAYGRGVARSLGAELAAAGLTVVSGMALGIDACAHEGALDAADRAAPAGGAGALARTIAVLAGGPDVAYPATHRRLHARIAAQGIAVSEVGPGIPARRWMFVARNRIIAALSAMTVLVQARERSGALITVEWARRLRRRVGAVPGPVTTTLSAGPHRALREGATLVAGAQDGLDALYGAGEVAVAERVRTVLTGPVAALLEGLGDGENVPAAFARAGLDGEAGLAALARLELDGLVRRGPGGRWVVA